MIAQLKNAYSRKLVTHSSPMRYHAPSLGLSPQPLIRKLFLLFCHIALFIIRLIAALHYSGITHFVR